MKYISNIYQKGKNYIQNNKDLLQVVLPSILAGVVCIACLLGGTYAWFSMSSSSNVGNIKTSSYTLHTTVITGENNLEPVNGFYALEANVSYTISITAQGTSPSGFVNVQIGEHLFNTVTLLQGETISFTITPTQNSNLSLIPVWGLNKISTNVVQNGMNYVYDRAQGSLTIPQSVVETEPTVPEEQPTEPEATPEVTPTPTPTPSPTPEATPESSVPEVTPTPSATPETEPIQQQEQPQQENIQ